MLVSLNQNIANQSTKTTPQREIRPLELNFPVEGVHVYTLYCLLHADLVKLW